MRLSCISLSITDFIAVCHNQGNSKLSCRACQPSRVCTLTRVKGASRGTRTTSVYPTHRFQSAYISHPPKGTLYTASKSPIKIAHETEYGRISFHEWNRSERPAIVATMIKTKSSSTREAIVPANP